MAVKITWLYLFLGRRVAAFERLVDDFAGRTEPQRLSTLSLRDLRLLLSELMDIRCHRWTNASLADAASMVCYALLRRMVQQASSGALHNTLLKAIPQLVSGKPVQQLWKLSRTVRESFHSCCTGFPLTSCGIALSRVLCSAPELACWTIRRSSA